MYSWKEPGVLPVPGKFDGISRVCRRYPPAVNVTLQQVKGGMTSAVVGNFPPVNGAAWCGEYLPKAANEN